MLTVEQLIGDLLIQNNCVIVPSFGGFVAQRVAARVDEQKGTIAPPRKSVMFNKQLINNDGLLIAAFAQNNQLSFEAASVQIKECIHDWDQMLQQGGRVTIDRVGILFYDLERNLCFEQDRFYNLLLESFGLSSVHFVSTSDAQAGESQEQVRSVVKAIELESEKTVIPVADIVEFTQEPVVPVMQVVREETPVETKIPVIKKSGNKAWRYVAAACLLPVAFYSFWLPVKTDVLESGIISWNDFDPFYKHEAGKYKSLDEIYSFSRKEVRKQLETLPEGVNTFSYELDADTYVPVSINKKQEAPIAEALVEEKTAEPIQKIKPIENPKPIVTPVQTVKPAGGQIIVGSYSSRQFAQEMVDLLAKNNITGTILEQDGKIRVSAGAANQFKTIEPTLKSLGIASWILK